jgi:hypothetical protein
MPAASAREYLSVVPLLCIIAYLIYQTTWRFQGPGFAQPGWVWVVIFLPLLVALGPMLWRLRRPRPESITLGVDEFRHDLGRAAGYRSYYDVVNRGTDHRRNWEWLFGAPRVVEAHKDEIGRIILEKDGQRRLRYDFGADRIEIGRYLREPEREWLAQVLQEWQRSGKSGPREPEEDEGPGAFSR